MLYLHCTADDLLNVSLTQHPAPLGELALALATSQQYDVHSTLVSWRPTMARSLPRSARPLLQLLSPRGAGPFFLDPPVSTFDEGLQHVLSTSRTDALAELQRICAIDRPRTPWIRRLAERDREAWTILEHALRGGLRRRPG